MSLKISVSIDDAGALSSIKAKRKALADKEGMHGSIAEFVSKLTREHINDNYVPRDGPRGDFWADVRDSISSTADENLATVSLSELGIVLRYHGGEVTPGKSISSFTGKPTRALAIPSASVPVSGGRQIRPGRAGLLAFIEAANQGDTVGYLVEGQEVIRKRDTKRGVKGTPYTVPKPGGDLLYTLRKITRHKGDKKILPDEADLVDVAKSAIFEFVDSFQ